MNKAKPYIFYLLAGDGWQVIELPAGELKPEYRITDHLRLKDLDNCLNFHQTGKVHAQAFATREEAESFGYGFVKGFGFCKEIVKLTLNKL